MPTTHRLRATIADIDPSIWREIEIDSTASLRDLHDALQKALGWQRPHLWLFRFAGQRAAPPELEDERARGDRRVRLDEALPAAGAVGARRPGRAVPPRGEARQSAVFLVPADSDPYTAGVTHVARSRRSRS
jgi:hypothetical protein